MLSPSIEKLISSLKCLPGVGPKSAQRMALHILERDQQNGLALADALQNAIANVSHCSRCRLLCETELCQICSAANRDTTKLCVVETPSDVFALEQTANYRGYYFVLMGHLSPIDGIGPQDIGIPQLTQLVEQQSIEELILATNPTVEGEATAHYIANLMKEKNTSCSRIAHGVPSGSELEYLDGITIARAFSSRTAIEES